MDPFGMNLDVRAPLDGIFLRLARVIPEIAGADLGLRQRRQPPGKPRAPSNLGGMALRKPFGAGRSTSAARERAVHNSTRAA